MSRAVGPNTLAQLEAGVVSRAVRVSVYDEAGTEIPINPDLLVGFPVVKGSIDEISWRMDLSVRVDSSMVDVLQRGRTIQAWDVFAQGEDLELFKGKIVEPQIPKDYSEGTEKVVAQVVAVGQLADRLEAHLTRFKWSPAPFNPDAVNPYLPLPGERQRLTGIVKRYRLTMLAPTKISGSTVNGAATNPTSSQTDIPVVDGTQFADGDQVYIYRSTRLAYTATVVAKPSANVIRINKWISPSVISVGDPVRVGAAVVPINLPYFGDNVLESWLTVYNASGSAVGSSGNWLACYESISHALTILFLTSPGSKFTIDVMAVERWVLLDRRKYHDGTTATTVAPHYYLLDGVAGQAGSERLNDQGKTTVVANPDYPASSTQFFVEDPTGLFASTTGTYGADRWVSVWSAAGVEYRGKVDIVEKDDTIPVYGGVILKTGFELRSEAGALYTPQPGDIVANTSSTHHEILDPSARVILWDSAGNFSGPAFVPVTRGGWFMLGYKSEEIMFVTPGYYEDLMGVPGFWEYLQDGSIPIAIEPADKNPSNDVSATLQQLLEALGYDVSEITLGATGYTMAPFTRSNVKALDLLDQVRKETIPPNYRLLEDEAGRPVGSYVQQAAAGTVTLRGVRNFSPREKPQRVTRVVVKGKQISTNRAGQLMHVVEGIDGVNRLFDGFSPENSSTSGIEVGLTTEDPARAVFKLSKTEPGRFPIVEKVVVSSEAALKPWVGACSVYHRTALDSGMSVGSSYIFTYDNRPFEIGQKIRIISKTVAGRASVHTVTGKDAGNDSKIYLDRPTEFAWNSGDQVVSALTYLPPNTTPNNVSQTFQRQEFSEGFEEILTGQLSPEGECYLVVEWNVGDGSTVGFAVDEVELYIREGAYWEARFVEGPGDEFGSGWSVPDRTLSMSQRTAPAAWLKQNMADYAKGFDRVMVIEAEGLTQAQAREIAEAWLNQAIRNSEFYDCVADYDPRVQRGDSVNIDLPDGSTRVLLVWAIDKGERTMKLQLADYSR